MNTILKWRETAQELPEDDRRVLTHHGKSDTPYIVAVYDIDGWADTLRFEPLYPPERWAYLDETTDSEPKRRRYPDDETEPCLPALSAEGDGDGEYAGISIGDYDIEFRKDADTFAVNIGKKDHGYVRVLHNEKANHLRVGVYGAGDDAPELFDNWFDYSDLTEGIEE